MRNREDYDFEQAFDDAPYHGESDEIRRFLALVLLRLPERIREFAIERCAVLSVGHNAYGITWPARIAKKWRVGINRRWLILLTENLPPGDEESIIAHEIAHAYLGHDRGSPDLPQDCEEQACNLVAKWGFSGKGADAAYCK